MAQTAPESSSGETRERILEAALRAFSEKGFDGATTRDIATQAGVNLGLIQYYFGGKDKLWRAAVDRVFEELHAGLERVTRDMPDGDDVERMRALIHAHVRFVAGHVEFIRIMHDEGKRRGPRMRWLVDRHVKPLYEGVRSILTRARDRGLLPRDIDPLHFHYVLIGSVALIFHQAEECKRLTGHDPAEEAMVEAHARAVEHLFLGPPHQETDR
ncbi:MAG: TetR/AcrR family transcriptional regulator [Myxococcota bacterium]